MRELERLLEDAQEELRVVKDRSQTYITPDVYSKSKARVSGEGGSHSNGGREGGVVPIYADDGAISTVYIKGLVDGLLLSCLFLAA